MVIRPRIGHSDWPAVEAWRRVDVDVEFYVNSLDTCPNPAALSCADG